MRPPPQRPEQGFTLLEVLVALTIVGIALTAGLQSSSALTRQAERQSLQWLAQLCAENQLVQLRLLAQLPDVGDTSHSCPQAEHNLTVHLHVRGTPNPSFRRVEASVDNPDPAALGGQLLQVVTIMGRY